MLIKFFLSRDIRSSCNTTHNNKQYVPITGYRRQLHKDKYCILISGSVTIVLSSIYRLLYASFDCNQNRDEFFSDFERTASQRKIYN